MAIDSISKYYAPVHETYVFVPAPCNGISRGKPIRVQL